MPSALVPLPRSSRLARSKPLVLVRVSTARTQGHTRAIRNPTKPTNPNQSLVEHVANAVHSASAPITSCAEPVSWLDMV